MFFFFVVLSGSALQMRIQIQQTKVNSKPHPAPDPQNWFLYSNISKLLLSYLLICLGLTLFGQRRGRENCHTNMGMLQGSHIIGAVPAHQCVIPWQNTGN
jgi:hypothetical protein